MADFSVVFRKSIGDQEPLVVKTTYEPTGEMVIQLAEDYYHLMQMNLIKDYNTVQVIDEDTERVIYAQSLELDDEDNTQTIRAKIELITFSTDDFIEDVEVNCNGYIYDVEVLEEITEEEYTTLICKFEVDGNHDFYDIIMDCTSVSDADILEVYNN